MEDLGIIVCYNFIRVLVDCSAVYRWEFYLYYIVCTYK